MKINLETLVYTAGVVCLLAVCAASSESAVAADRSVGVTPVNDRWANDERATIASMRLSQLPPLPKEVSNAVDGSPAARDLGKRLFNDERFSRNGKVSCASCHDPLKSFQDGRPVGIGVGVGSRRSMPVVAAGYGPWLFWDGRKDSVWAQALGPLEDAVEHGGNRSNYAHLIEAHYRAEYEAIFQPMPDLTGVPPDAGPQGLPAEKTAWDGLAKTIQNDVSRIFANIGKLIAAYERTLSYGQSRFDRYAEAVVKGVPAGSSALTSTEIDGLRIFIGKGQCATCHNGPLFTDQHFHNTGVPQRDAASPDRGRAVALAKVVHDEFNCLGPFSDANANQCDELRFIASGGAELEGAFKTPGLRNVTSRAPYMHAGQFASLEQVVGHYVKAPAASVGHTELAHGAAGHTERKPIALSSPEVEALIAFLGTLSSPIIEGSKK